MKGKRKCPKCGGSTFYHGHIYMCEKCEYMFPDKRLEQILQQIRDSPVWNVS